MRVKTIGGFDFVCLPFRMEGKDIEIMGMVDEDDRNTVVIPSFRPERMNPLGGTFKTHIGVERFEQDQLFICEYLDRHGRGWDNIDRLAHLFCQQLMEKENRIIDTHLFVCIDLLMLAQQALWEQILGMSDVEGGATHSWICLSEDCFDKFREQIFVTRYTPRYLRPFRPSQSLVKLTEIPFGFLHEVYPKKGK